jgi:hypothetical protein
MQVGCSFTSFGLSSAGGRKQGDDCATLPRVEGGFYLVKKIQLNDEQWRTLLALHEAHVRRSPTQTISVSERLLSNGLVGRDRQGSKFLTEQGRERLNQGR